MQAFLIQLAINLVVAAALAFLSAALYRPKSAEPPEPQKDDFEPTAEEGTEIRHLFGTGAVQMVVVAVMDRQVEPILR